MVHLDLTDEEARLLLTELSKERQHIHEELVHTDNRAMQSAIVDDLSDVDRLVAKVLCAIGVSGRGGAKAAARPTHP